MPNKDQAPTGAAYTALHGLLGAVAYSVTAQEVCLISPEGEPNCVTLVSSVEGQAVQGLTYTASTRDLAVPVYYDNRQLAQLVVINADDGLDRSSLENFARAVGYLLAHSSDINDTQYTVEEGRVLHDLGLHFGAPTELSELLDSVVKGVRRVLGADYANLTTVGEDGSRHWLAMDGYQTEAYKQYAYRKGRGTAGRIMRERGPVLLEGIGVAPDLPAEEFPIHAAEGGVSALAVPLPLMVRGTPIGALTLGSRKPRAWKPNEVQLVSVLANGAALAIEQARSSKSERAQRAFLERVIENFPGVLLVVGPPPDWRVVVANSQFNQFLPEPYRSGKSIVGLTASELSPGDQTEQGQNMQRLLAHVFETGEQVSFEQFESANPYVGTTYWNWVALPIDNASEQDERLLMLIAHNITESVQARRSEENSARTARARAEELDKVIAHMADGLAIFNELGTLVKMNPAGQAIFGHGVIEGSSAAKYVEQYGLYQENGELFKLDELPSMRALKGETVIGVTMLVHPPGSSEKIMQVSCSPLTDAQGTITGAVSVLHDVTQEKTVERLKDEFLSIVSHELRTPLTAIIGYSDLMMRGVHGTLSDRQGKVLNSVRANADRLLRLINDLLDVSKLESGSVHLNSEPINTGETANRIIAQTRILAENNKVQVENLLTNRQLNMVLADEQKLQQIVENLVSNAIKFTPGGTVIVDGYMSLLASDDPLLMREQEPQQPLPGTGARSLVISVSDSGEGMEQNQLERIWDRFYQADTSVKRRSGGAGLGLSIVRRLVEMHGGRVWATSGGEGRGSTFNFSLPVALGELASSRSLPDTSLMLDAERTRDRRPVMGTVLVAEDDADQREIICEMLEMDGFEVVLAQTGAEALDKALKIQPSAIALDVILPRMDGWQVLEQLRRHPSTKDIPVLIISVVDQAEFGKKLGANEYLLKPLDPSALRSTMRRLVQTRRQGGPLSEPAQEAE